MSYYHYIGSKVMRSGSNGILYRTSVECSRAKPKCGVDELSVLQYYYRQFVF